MKLMIMNYKPYEYELLQDKLDALGKKGYKTNHLSYISFLKKPAGRPRALCAAPRLYSTGFLRRPFPMQT